MCGVRSIFFFVINDSDVCRRSLMTLQRLFVKRIFIAQLLVISLLNTLYFLTLILFPVKLFGCFADRASQYNLSN